MQLSSDEYAAAVASGEERMTVAPVGAAGSLDRWIQAARAGRGGASRGSRTTPFGTGELWEPVGLEDPTTEVLRPNDCAGSSGGYLVGREPRKSAPGAQHLRPGETKPHGPLAPAACFRLKASAAFLAALGPSSRHPRPAQTHQGAPSIGYNARLP
jgi:hypothetical protein